MSENNNKASHGNTALSAYVNEIGDQGDEETNLSDLLADLHHMSDALGLDWAELLNRSAEHYEEEVSDHGRATNVGGHT